jgi:small-conductance mechanosensitive channel
MKRIRQSAVAWMGACVAMLALVAAAAAVPAVPPLVGAPPALSVAQPDSAVLEVFNRRVMVFRSSFGSWRPQDRVAEAQHRIERILGKPRVGPVTTRPIPQGMMVEVGERGAFIVFPSDVDSAAAETVQGVATAAAARLGDALTAAAEQRRPGRILRAVLLSLAGTVVFLLGLRLLMWINGWLRDALRTHRAHARRRIKILNLDLVDIASLEQWTGRLVSVLLWVLGILLLDLWVTWVLGRFPYTQPWAAALGGWFFGTVRRLVLGTIGIIPGLLTVALIFLLTRFVLRLSSSFFTAVQTRRLSISWLHPDVALPTQRIVATLLWIFAAMVAYPYLPGSGSGIFKGISLFVGVVLSFGSSALVQQAMSGFVLMYSRSFRKGEYVRVGDTEGTIRDLGMLSTRIETNKHELVTIPNTVVVAAQIKNYSRIGDEGTPVLLSTAVTIGYDAPWRLVHAMLTEAAGRTPNLLREPAPLILQTALSDFYVEYMLAVPTATPHQRIPTLAALHGHIQDVFNENGVQIMSPHFIDQPADKVWSPPKDWQPPLVRQTKPAPPA